MQPRALFFDDPHVEEVDEDGSWIATDDPYADDFNALKLTSELNRLRLDFERIRVELKMSESAHRANVERQQCEFVEQQDMDQFKIAELQAQLANEPFSFMADCYDAEMDTVDAATMQERAEAEKRFKTDFDFLEEQDECEFELAQLHCADGNGDEPVNALHYPSACFEPSTDSRFLEMWAELHAERQLRIALQDEYELASYLSTAAALSLHKANRERASHAHALEQRLAISLDTNQQLEAQLADVERERKSSSARLKLALEAQKAELEDEFKAQLAAAGSRAARQERNLRSELSALRRGHASRGDAVAHDLARLASKSALP